MLLFSKGHFIKRCKHDTLCDHDTSMVLLVVSSTRRSCMSTDRVLFQVSGTSVVSVSVQVDSVRGLGQLLVLLRLVGSTEVVTGRV